MANNDVRNPDALVDSPIALVDSPIAGHQAGFSFRFVAPAGGKITGMRVWCALNGALSGLQILATDIWGSPADSHVIGYTGASKPAPGGLAVQPPPTTEIVLGAGDVLIGITGKISGTGNASRVDNIVLHTGTEKPGDPEKLLGPAGGQTPYWLMPENASGPAEVVGIYGTWGASGFTSLGVVNQPPGAPGVEHTITPGDLIGNLSPGETILFPPDARFALHSQGALFVGFRPGWTAENIDPKSPDDENAPILIQCGRKNSPGEMFRIQVRQDMKTLIFSSSADSLATCTVDADCSAGAQILVCFNNDQGMRVIVSFQTSDPSSIWQARALPFNLGPVDDELAPLLQLQLGGANGADGIGFSGSIGKLLLFDRDIFPLLAQDTQNQDRNQIEKNLALISAWVNDARVLTPFFDGLLSPSQLKYVGAMVGFAVLPAARKPARPGAAARAPEPVYFDFLPREIPAPEDMLARWMLFNGDLRPQKTRVPGLKPDLHSIYTTNNVFCFPRIQGAPYLWGDGGQSFRLKYAGKSQFTGTATLAGGRSLSATLTYKPAPPHDKLQLPRMEITPHGWDNTTEHIFATCAWPAGAELQDDIAQNDPEIWPYQPMLKRVAATYIVQNGITKGNPQTWNDAFASTPGQISCSMKGWDITKLNNPLDPVGTNAALRDRDHYLFTPPDQDYYLVDEQKVATPYYCCAIDLHTEKAYSDTQVYRSSYEYANKVSDSFGLGLSEGKDSLLSASFDDVKQTGKAASAAHSIATTYDAGFMFATALERQWLTLNETFVSELEEAIGGIDATGPAAHPHQWDILLGLFRAWGTHYANSVTYGYTAYSLALIDEAALEDMAAKSATSKIGIGLPLDGLLASMDVAHGTEESKKNAVSTQAEIHRGLKVGKDGYGMPIRLDLRPITDLLQPPYINNDEVLAKFPFISQGLRMYLDKYRKQSPDGVVIYKMRLVSLSNSGDNPCYVNLGLSLAGVTEVDEWKVVLPGETARVIDVRIPAKGDYTVPPQTYSSLSIPTRAGLVPGISLSAFRVTTYDKTIRARLWDSSNRPDRDVWDSDLVEAEDKFGKSNLGTAENNVGIPADQPKPSFQGPGGGGFGPKPTPSEPGKWEMDEDTLTASMKLTGLPDNGTLQTFTIASGTVTATFESRKIDLQSCFEELTKTATQGK